MNVMKKKVLIADLDSQMPEYIGCKFSNSVTRGSFESPLLLKMHSGAFSQTSGLLHLRPMKNLASSRKIQFCKGSPPQMEGGIVARFFSYDAMNHHTGAAAD